MKLREDKTTEMKNLQLELTELRKENQNAL